MSVPTDRLFTRRILSPTCMPLRCAGESFTSDVILPMSIVRPSWRKRCGSTRIATGFVRSVFAAHQEIDRLAAIGREQVLQFGEIRDGVLIEADDLVARFKPRLRFARRAKPGSVDRLDRIARLDHFQSQVPA